MGAPALDVDVDALLTDAGIVRIRTTQPGDAEEIRALYDGVSADTLYLRFFTVSHHAVAAEVEALTRPAADDHVSLVAEIGGQVVGAATFERLAEPADEAEIAFLVDDTHRGRGVGTLLLEHLASIARARGIVRFVADTLPGNSRMLRVFAAAGLPATTRYRLGVVRVELPLQFDDDFRIAVDQREALADAASLRRVLAPRSVAVVGAGSDPAGLGHQILANIVRGGYRGDLYAVNRSGHRVAGVAIYTELAAVPGLLDVVIVVVPAAEALDVARAAAARDVAGLVVVSAGFAESGSAGARLQHELVRICRDGGMRLIGPNCMGIANAGEAVSLNATFCTTLPPAGGVGLMSQSGAVGIAALEYAARSGVGISSFVSAGNKADVSGNDLLCSWEDDDATTVCALYLESLGNPRKFARIAARVGRQKPVVAVKSGRSIAGTRGVASHTASAATPDIAVDSLFEQAGVTRVDSLSELFDVASLFDLAPLPRGPRVAIVGNSGGPGVLAADACEAAGLQVVPLSAQTRRRLSAVSPAGAPIGNPVDLLAVAGPQAFEAALRVLLDDDDIDAVISVYAPIVTGSASGIGRAIATVQADRPGKPLLACFLGLDTMPSDLRGPDGRPVAPYFAFPEPAARALAAAVRYAQWRVQPDGHCSHLDGIDVAAARAIVVGQLATTPDGGWLDAITAARLVATHGVHIAEVTKAFTPTASWLGDRMTGAIVQPMNEAGVETAIGIVSDPTFGPLVMVGLGGIASDLLADRAFHLLPLTAEDAARQIRSLRGAPLLFGYRNTPRCDVAALEQMVLRVAQLAENVPELVELDLNPVTVTPTGAIAVDVKARLAPASPIDPLLRRLR